MKERFATESAEVDRILAADPWLARLTADDSPLGIMVELTQRESVSQGAKVASANCARHWRDLRRQLALRSLPSSDGRRLHAEVLRVLEKLIPDDPAPDSIEGQILVTLATAVEAYELASRSEKPAECEWRADSDGIYHTDCGNAFTFDSGTATENSAKFCQYCGGGLVDVPAEEEA
jgi:hypothetical protein